MKKSSFYDDRRSYDVAADGCCDDGSSGDGDDDCYGLCPCPDCYNKAATNPSTDCGGGVEDNPLLSQ